MSVKKWLDVAGLAEFTQDTTSDQGLTCNRLGVDSAFCS